MHKINLFVSKVVLIIKGRIVIIKLNHISGLNILRFLIILYVLSFYESPFKKTILAEIEFFVNVNVFIVGINLYFI